MRAEGSLYGDGGSSYYAWHDGIPTWQSADPVAGYPEPTYALSAVVMRTGDVKVFWRGNTDDGLALLVTSGP